VNDFNIHFKHDIEMKNDKKQAQQQVNDFMQPVIRVLFKLHINKGQVNGKQHNANTYHNFIINR
jgi:hypothetical protein